MCTPHFKVKLYLQSEMLTKKEKENLAALRSHCVRGMKHNFLKTYSPLNREREANLKDTQSHILICKSLNEGAQIPLYEIYSENYVNQTQNEIKKSSQD